MLQAPTPAWVDDTSSYGGPSAATAISERYRDVAAKIIATARADRGAYKKLAYLTEQIGNRLAGSPALDKEVSWAAQAMKDDGHDVRTELDLSSEPDSFIFLTLPTPHAGYEYDLRAFSAGSTSVGVARHTWRRAVSEPSAAAGATASREASSIDRSTISTYHSQPSRASGR